MNKEKVKRIINELIDELELNETSEVDKSLDDVELIIFKNELLSLIKEKLKIENVEFESRKNCYNDIFDPICINIFQYKRKIKINFLLKLLDSQKDILNKCYPPEVYYKNFRINWETSSNFFVKLETSPLFINIPTKILKYQSKEEILDGFEKCLLNALTAVNDN